MAAPFENSQPDVTGSNHPAQGPKTQYRRGFQPISLKMGRRLRQLREVLEQFWGAEFHKVYGSAGWYTATS